MKKFSIAMFAAALAVSTIALARVAPDQIALGGVAPGMTIAQLTAAAGEPGNKAGDDWFYPNFKVEFDDDRPGVVESVSAYAPPAAIPAGLAVGQPESSIVPALGEPDAKDYDDGETEYEYYSTDFLKKLEIEVRGGVITKISCSIRD